MKAADHPNNCPLAREVIELGHGKKFITGTDGWRVPRRRQSTRRSTPPPCRYGVPRRTSEGGGYDPVTFSHPAIARAVAVMGWERICDGDNESADFAQFRNTYNAYREREIRAAQLGQPAFLPLPPPVLNPGLKEFTWRYGRGITPGTSEDGGQLGPEGVQGPAGPRSQP